VSRVTFQNSTSGKIISFLHALHKPQQTVLKQNWVRAQTLQTANASDPLAGVKAQPAVLIEVKDAKTMFSQRCLQTA